MNKSPPISEGFFLGNGGIASGGSLNGRRKSEVFSRVVVVGANGAGKTWVARRLADCTGAQVIHKDALALTKRWVQRPKAEVRTHLHKLIADEAWILEGGPSVLSGEVCRRATLIVWLDMPRALRIWRIGARSLRYIGRTRPEHPAGNRDWPGMRQLGFIRRAWAQDDRFRSVIVANLDDVKCPCLHLKARGEVSALIEAARQCAEGL